MGICLPRHTHGSCSCTFAQLPHTTHQQTGQQPIKGQTEDLQPSGLAAGQAPMPRPTAAGRHATAGFHSEKWR